MGTACCCHLQLPSPEPLVGREKCANFDLPSTRQALHSYSLSFIHPFTKEKLNFESKLPKDIELLKKTIEKFI